MVAYGEFRKAFDGDEADERMVFYGIRYIIDTFVSQPWTMQDYELMALFMSTHNAGKTSFPFPSDLFLKVKKLTDSGRDSQRVAYHVTVCACVCPQFINENNGYFPVKIEALPEGACVHACTENKRTRW